MTGGKTLLVIGIIVTIFGGIFHLQGHSIVGPETSFMYSNPDWITYGLEVIVVGTIISVVGFVIMRKN
jgi:hypothetical protein